MKRQNYYQVHKNKTPKKAKYSKRYSKNELINFANSLQHFSDEVEKLNKKKPLLGWYDEDQTTERMNIIGQNGNDGEHYENK